MKTSHYLLSLRGRNVLACGMLSAEGELHAQFEGRRLRATVVATAERRQVFYQGRSWPFALVDTRHVGGSGEEAEGGLKAPMPGKVISLLVEPGSSVEKGTPLLVLEAMKMEHVIAAPRKGVVKEFRFAPGDQVTDGADLLDLKEPRNERQGANRRNGPS